MLQAVIWDFDGVIVDSERAHSDAFLEVVRPMGISYDYPTYLRRYVGFDDRDGFAAILKDGGLPVPTGEELQKLCAQKADAFERLISQNADVLPGSVELIQEIHQSGRVRQAIASGATQRDIDVVLENLGLQDHFPVIVSADDVERSKPDPTSYALAVERLAAHHELVLLPWNCLAIEDTNAGLTSASDAGLMTLGLATTTKAELLKKAMRVIDNLQGVDIAQLQAWYPPK